MVMRAGDREFSLTNWSGRLTIAWHRVVIPVLRVVAMVVAWAGFLGGMSIVPGRISDTSIGRVWVPTVKGLRPVGVTTTVKVASPLTRTVLPEIT